MKNLLILKDQTLYLYINDGTNPHKVYVRNPNMTAFIIRSTAIPFETLEKRLIDKSLDSQYYTHTSASNPTELKELHPELFL